MILYLRKLWCRAFHHEAGYPTFGKYKCPKCWLEWPAWDAPLHQSLTEERRDVIITAKNLWG